MENKSTLRNIILFYITGTLPIFIIFIFSDMFYFLHDIFNLIKDYPAVYSSKYEEISRLASNYCKLAPMFAILMILFSVKIKNIDLNNVSGNIFLTQVMLFITCCLFFYLLYLYNYDLSYGRKSIRVIASNKSSLAIYYMACFFSAYILTFSVIIAFLFIPIKKYMNAR